jgi:hypothetical protein
VPAGDCGIRGVVLDYAVYAAWHARVHRIQGTGQSVAGKVFGGRYNRMSARLDLGTPAPAATALVAGGDQYESGLAVVDPATVRVVRRVPMAPARPLAKNHTHYLHEALWVAQPGQLWRVGSASAEPYPGTAAHRLRPDGGRRDQPLAVAGRRPATGPGRPGDRGR